MTSPTSNQDQPSNQTQSNRLPLHSANSGSYRPGPINETGAPSAELADVQAHTLDLALEEFPEGPYGATTNEVKLGKVSEWKQGQTFSGRFRDSNMVTSDRTVATEESEKDESDTNFDQKN